MQQYSRVQFVKFITTGCRYLLYRIYLNKHLQINIVRVDEAYGSKTDQGKSVGYMLHDGSVQNNEEEQLIIPEAIPPQKHHSKKRIIPDQNDKTDASYSDIEVVNQLKNVKPSMIQKSQSSVSKKATETTNDLDTKSAPAPSTTTTVSSTTTKFNHWGTFNPNKYIPSKGDKIAAVDEIPGNYQTDSSSLDKSIVLNTLPSFESKDQEQDIDVIGIVEYVLLGIFVVFDVVLLAYCICTKCRGKLNRIFNGEHIQKHTQCGKICDYFSCCNRTYPPYRRVISVQDISNEGRMSQNNLTSFVRKSRSDQDFEFDDQYLELNEYAGERASSKDPKQDKSIANDVKGIKHTNSDTKKGDKKLFHKFSTSIQRNKKSKYVRLDDVFQECTEKNKYDGDESTHGYWNPTYFSLEDDTDV